jgi:hypothetical protein
MRSPFGAPPFGAKLPSQDEKRLRCCCNAYVAYARAFLR